MSQDNNDFDYDLDDINLEEDVEVERLGTQHQNAAKAKAKASQQAKSQASKQQKAVEKDAAAKAAAVATEKQQQAAASQQQQQHPTHQQRRLDDMFKQSQQQRSQQQQQQSSTLDIEALLRNATGGGNDDDAAGGGGAGSALLASLMSGDVGDSDEDEEFDINKLLGLTSSNNDDDVAVKVEIPFENDDAHQQHQQQQQGHRQQRSLFAIAQQQQVLQQRVKVEVDAASPSHPSQQQQQQVPAVAGASKSAQNFTLAAAPEMKFEMKNENFDVKMEVKVEDNGVFVQESNDAAGNENVSGDQKKLPPPISPEDRRRKILAPDELNNAEKKITLRNVYWFDAKESTNNEVQDLNGTVLLFGRIAVRDSSNAASATYKSVCVRVPMKRYVIFLPKQHFVSETGELPQDKKTAAILEARALCSKRGITNGAFKWVKRRYAFEEKDVPTEESEWLKLKYPATHAPLWGANDNTPHFDNFQAVFGVHRSLMELLFINKRFEGPGFLDLTNATAVPAGAKRRSICQYEFILESEEDVFVLSGTPIQGVPNPPSLTAASLHLRTQLDASGHKHEIFAATIAMCTFDTESSSAQAPPCRPYLGIRQWSTKPEDKLPYDLIKKGMENNLQIKDFADERELLRWVLQTLKDLDPDIIIGHNIIGFSLGVLFTRIDELQLPRTMPDWCSLGRLQWKNVPRQLGAQKGGAGGGGGGHTGTGTGFWEKEVCAGRLLVDTYTLAREYHKTSNYRLLSLAAELQLSGVFGPVMDSHVEQPPEMLNSVKMQKADDVVKILGQDYNFALLCVRLTHKLGLIPLTKQLTTVAGTVWSRVLNGARSERIEYLLMHAFHQLKFVTPDKSGYKQRLALQQQAAQLEADKQKAIDEAKTRAASAAAAAAAAAAAEPQDDEDGEKNNNNNTAERVVTKSKKSTGATTIRRQRPTGASAISAADVFDNGGLCEDDDDDIAVDGEGVAIDDEDDLLDGLVGEDEAANGAASSNGPSATSKKTAKYKGGRVLEPEVGLYRDYVLLLDFNSLYPSLIQEFNVCFTTVERVKGAAALHDRSEPKIPSRDTLICEACLKLPNARDLYPCKHRCILPKVIKQLVDKRKNVRNQMKRERNPSTLNQLEIRQKAYKLTANSMYGCLGFEHSRFYAQKLAELVTLQGRNALGKTVEVVNMSKHNPARVVYGDTDSVMISTGEFDDLDKIKTLAQAIQKEVNKKYKHLELGMDGVFRSLLLHKKKKYAALTVTDWQGAGKQLKQEVKGLEMVRRDWCKLAKQACGTVLKTALDPKLTDAEEVVETIGSALEKLADRVLNGQEPLNSYVIAKSIQRDPKAYKDAGAQPHVQVAIRMQNRKLPVFAGDLIPYVICDPSKPATVPAAATAAAATTDDAAPAVAAGTVASPDQQQQKEKDKKPTPTQQVKLLAQRAFHEDEVKEQSLKIDAEWYLANQIYPPVLRLCEHIQGFTPEFLISKLKLTKSAVGLHEERVKNNNNQYGGQARPAFAVTFKGMTLEQAYPEVAPLIIKCRRCGESHKQVPHTYATQILNKNHLRYQREFPRPDLVEKNKIIKKRWFTQAGILERVPWFYCSNSTCPDPFFSPSTVENSISLYLDAAVRQFYSAPNARSDAKYKKLLDQVGYIQRLIEVPASLIDPLERSLWSRAARFVDASGKWRNAEEVAAAQRNTHKTYNGDEAMIRLRDDILKSKLVGKEALDRFLPLLPALRIDFGAEFFTTMN